MNYFIWMMLGLGCDGVNESESESTSSEAQIEQTESGVEKQDVSSKKTKLQRVMAQLKPRVFDHVDSVALGLSQQSTGESHLYSMGLMELGLREPAMFSRLPDVSTYVMKHFNVPSSKPSKDMVETNLSVRQPSASGAYLLFQSDSLLGVVETEENNPVALYVGSSAIQFSRFSNDSRIVLVVERGRVAAVPIRSKSTNEEERAPVIFDKPNASLVKELMLLSDETRMVIHTDDGQVTLLNNGLDIDPVVLATDVKGMIPYPNKDWMLLIKEGESEKHLEMFDVNTQKSIVQFDAEGEYIGLMRPPHLVYVVNDKSVSIVDTSIQSKAFEVQVDHPVINVVAHSKEPMLLIQTEQDYLLLDLQQEAFVELPKYIIDAHFDSRGNIHYTSVKAKNSRGREYIKESRGQMVQASWFDDGYNRLSRWLSIYAFDGYWLSEGTILNVYQGVYNTSTREKEERRISESDDLKIFWNGMERRYDDYGRDLGGKILGQDTDWVTLRGSVKFKDFNYGEFVVFSSVYTDDSKLSYLEYIQRDTGLRKSLNSISDESDVRLMPDGELLYFHEGTCGWFDLQMENHSVECSYLAPLNRKLFAHVNYPTVKIVNVESAEVIAKWDVTSFPNQWGIDPDGKSLAMRSEDTFVIYPDINDSTKSFTCTSETQSEECTLGAWLDLGLPFTMLSPSKYKSTYSTARVPVFSVDNLDVRSQDIVGIYLNRGILTDYYTRTLSVKNEDLGDDFYYNQYRYAFDRTGKWLRYSTGKGIVEYHLPTGRRMLGVNVEYPLIKTSRFQTVKEWLLTSLRSSQKRICPNSYVVVELEAADIDHSALSTFVSDDLVDTYCQYP